MIITIIKLLSIYFKNILIKILKASFVRNLLKWILKTNLKKIKIYFIAKLRA